jgi:energy-coupling factor transport system ATP-binding protein
MPIVLREVGFTYLPGTPLARRVLSSVDLEVREGEITCLMGKTGSGKSTLLSVVSGLSRATCGEILLDGERLAGKSGYRALRNAVGIMLQSSEKQLFAETVGRDVAFGPRNRGRSGEDVSALVRASLLSAGLDPEAYSSRSPFSLSGGEMRRAALAGVLALQPRYLLMDEPSSGLDLPGRERLHRTLEEQRQNGVGMLLVTHDWEEVELLADRVAILSAGSIILEGGKEDVLTSIDELASAGLRPPPLVEVLASLRRRGFDLPLRTASPADTAALIAAAIGGMA